jgi:hypothetical protein
MTRTLITILSINIIACEEANKPSTNHVDTQVQWDGIDDSVDGPQDGISQQQDSQPEPDLICSTGGMFDRDGNLHTLRMELFQKEGNIEIHASKGSLHPTSDEVFETTILEIDGVIGEDFLRLSIDEEHSISEEYELDTAVGIELGRIESNEELLYQGMFTNFGCGSYGGSYNSVTCWQPDIEPEFTYNPLNGVCLNAQKEIGYNPWTVEMIRETSDGQCAELEFVGLNEGDFEQPELSWDLRGSYLEYSQLYSANLSNARLEGTQMDMLYFSDSKITGTIDEFTSLPESCEIIGSEMFCEQ